MRFVLIILLACALGAGGFMAAKRLQKQSQTAGAAVKAASRQDAEMKQCRQRLAEFHQAWSRYRSAHKGAEPPTIETLVPRYIRDPKAFECPTAARFAKEGGRVDQGRLKVGGQDYSLTYGFLWLTASHRIERKEHADKAALANCGVHREVVYQAAYSRPLLGGEFDQPARGRLLPQVVQIPVLVVRRDGEVAEVAE